MLLSSSHLLLMYLYVALGTPLVAMNSPFMVTHTYCLSYIVDFTKCETLCLFHCDALEISKDNRKMTLNFGKRTQLVIFFNLDF